MHETYGKGRPYRPATINRELICLSAIFREAVKHDHVVKNPVRGIKLLAPDDLRKAVEVIVVRPAPEQPSETPPPGGP